MATTTHQLASTFFVCSAHATYSNAREKTNADVFTNESPWVGQYLSARHEVNQVFAAYDLSSIPAGATITSAKLTITVAESYGTFDLEIRASDWDGSNSLTSFVAGSALASKTLLGSRSITGSYIGTFDVTLSNVTRANLEKMVFASADQRTETPTTNDDTARLDNAVLEVTWTPPITNKSLVITTTGAGSWTPPAGVVDVYAEAWGGGGVSRNDRGGGGGYSAGWVSVVPGQPISLYVAARQFGGFANGNYPNIVGQDSWFGSSTTVMAKGANAANGGQASAGYGFVKFSGGSGAVSQGGGASASPYGDGGNGQADDYLEIGGASPSAGLGAVWDDWNSVIVRLAESHVDGGGGGADYDAASNPGEPGGGAGERLTLGDRMSSRGQVRLSWYEPDAPNGAGVVSLSSPRVQSSSTFTQPARTGAGTISLAPMVAASGVSVVPAYGAGGVSLRAPAISGLGSFSSPPSGGAVAGVSGWRTPGSVASIVDGNRSWLPLTASNLSAIDENYIRATGINSSAVSHILRSYNFGFTSADIPANATITGLEMEVVRRRTFGSGVPFARHARLSVDSGDRTVAAHADQIGLNNSTDVAWANTYTTAPYGGDGDMWGAALTPAMVTSSTFGFDYGLQGGAASMDAAVTQIRMRVFYTVPGGQWVIGVVSLKGPFVNASAGQNIQGAATVVLTAPQTVGQGFRGSSADGAISLASPAVSATGSHTRVGSGVVTLTAPSTQGLGAHGVEGSSAISLASPSASALGSYTRVGSGVVALAAPVVAADGQHTVGVHGLVNLGSPTVAAYASRGSLASSTITLTAGRLEAVSTHARGAVGSIALSSPSTQGQADHGVAGSGAVALQGPSVEAVAETFNEAISTVLIGSPAIEANAGHGPVAVGQVVLYGPAVEASASQITGAYSAVRIASPKAEADADHGVAGASMITLTAPSAQGSAVMVPVGQAAISLASPKLAAAVSQAAYAQVRLWTPMAASEASHGVSTHGLISLASPGVSGAAGVGATGQGAVSLTSPSVAALAQRGTASSGAVPLAMRVTGALVHSVAAGGMASLTIQTEGLADHGVDGQAMISLASPTVTGLLEPGLVHGAGMVSLAGPMVEGGVYIDLSTVYLQGAVVLGSPSVKARILTLPTHGQRTVLIAGEERSVAPPNEARSLNIGNEMRAVTVAPE